MFRVGGIIQDVKEDGREDIDHGGDILIYGLLLDRGEAFLRSFEHGSDVFGCHSLKRTVGMPTIEEKNSKNVY